MSTSTPEGPSAAPPVPAAAPSAPLDEPRSLRLEDWLIVLTMAALALQANYAVSQKEVMGNYWSPAEAFGATMEAKDYSKDIQTLLDEMVASITAK